MANSWEDNEEWPPQLAEMKLRSFWCEFKWGFSSLKELAVFRRQVLGSPGVSSLALFFITLFLCNSATYI